MTGSSVVTVTRVSVVECDQYGAGRTADKAPSDGCLSDRSCCTRLESLSCRLCRQLRQGRRVAGSNNWPDLLLLTSPTVLTMIVPGTECHVLFQGESRLV